MDRSGPDRGGRVMWVDCPGCDGTGRSIEGSCLSCGGRGVVFKKCCGCRDCREQVRESEDGEKTCEVYNCPKDHDVLPPGDRHPMEAG